MAFAKFDPNNKPVTDFNNDWQKLQLFIKRFEPSEEEIKTALDYFRTFLAEIETQKTSLLTTQEEI